MTETHLMTPNRAKNEEELNEDATKGQNTTHNDTGKWFCVENLVRNCTRNSIGANFFREFSSIKLFYKYLEKLSLLSLIAFR